MDRIIYFASPYFGFVLTYVFISQIIPKKKSYWEITVLLLPTLIPQVAKDLWGMFSVNAQAASVIVAIWGCLILPIIVFSCPKWKSIGLTVFFYATLFLLDAALYAVFKPIFGDLGEDFNAPQIAIYAVLTWTTYAALCAFIVWLFRMLKLRKLQSSFLLYMVFPLSQGILLYCSIYGMLNTVWAVGVVMGLGAQIALLVFSIRQEDRLALKEQLKETQHQIELEREHYQYIEQRQEELSRIRHDFNNQITAVSMLIQSGEKETAQKMIQSLTDAIAQTREHTYCAIPVVNAILWEKEKACREKAILLEVELDMPERCDVDSMHLCSVFSNLLDNAIRGAESAEGAQRKIHLVSKINGDYLFIKTENPVSEDARSRKPAGHGYGTGILKNIAEQYQGSYQTKIENGVFTAVISLVVN